MIFESVFFIIFTMLVCPVSFSFILFLFGAIVLTDGNVGEFSVNQAYIPVIEALLVTMVLAYFGGRTTEKATNIFKSK